LVYVCFCNINSVSVCADIAGVVLVLRNAKDMYKCRDCQDTGRIKLLVSEVDCDCTRRGCDGCSNCSSDLCECDGTCDPNCGGSCSRCEMLVCAHCLVEGMCHNCFAKLQGGVI